jgi:hypothetical protein
MILQYDFVDKKTILAGNLSTATAIRVKQVLY